MVISPSLTQRGWCGLPCPVGAGVRVVEMAFPRRNRPPERIIVCRFLVRIPQALNQRVTEWMVQHPILWLNQVVELPSGGTFTFKQGCRPEQQPEMGISGRIERVCRI